MKLIFTGTSSLGVRVQEISRYCLDRAIKKVKLPYGEADVKIGYFRENRSLFHRSTNHAGFLLSVPASP